MAVDVGVLGADSPTGCRFLHLLTAHETFAPTVVTTVNPDDAGLSYGETARWVLDDPMPPDVSDLPVVGHEPTDVPAGVELLFSALPSGTAERVETALADRGYVVCSTATNERLAADVPLVVPEINPEHVELLDRQRAERGWDGALIKNPGASTVTALLPLAALTEFGLGAAHITTFQGATGDTAGVPAMETLNNVVPHIDGEESRLVTELRKVLGSFDGERITPHDISLSASCNRVPMLEACFENVWLRTTDPVTPVDIESALRSAPAADLPSAPTAPVQVSLDPARPQPRLDAIAHSERLTDGEAGSNERGITAGTAVGGQTVTAGSVQTAVDGIQFDCVSHETIRGGAGGAILNAELLQRLGYL
jgi:aspartate-semialdehyde dehydrogenase